MTDIQQQTNYDVIIVGAGVSGLVSAAVLGQLGFSVKVIEKRASPQEAELGADLALWPGAITILKEIGVHASFFQNECCPLKTVHMCKLDFDHFNIDQSQNIGASATILKTINMTNVTQGTNENFILVSRKSLMTAIQEIVPTHNILYNATVQRLVEENNHYVTVTYKHNTETFNITSKIVIGADGTRSVVKTYIHPDQTHSDTIQYRGEICYRGILDTNVLNLRLQQNDKAEITSHNIFPDKAEESIMRINYGAGLRSSFGYMSADGSKAYWWVKQLAERMPDNQGKQKNCTWPEPLKTLHDLTENENVYVHPIEDSISLDSWSKSRMVLVGDAAHVVTPNMGQGACLAIEDTFVLCIQLFNNWNGTNGILKAFTNYEDCRKPYANAVADEARKQMFIGQWQNPVAVKLREVLLQLIPASILEKKLQQNNFPVKPYITRFHEATNKKI